MELKKLTKESLGKRSRKGICSVSFTRRGLVILSQKSLEKLDLDVNSQVDIFQGDTISEFFISKGSTYQLRQNGKGGSVFNCTTLCELVIDSSWKRYGRPTMEECPSKFSFTICDKPVDDEENALIFALIRKKA